MTVHDLYVYTAHEGDVKERLAKRIAKLEKEVKELKDIISKQEFMIQTLWYQTADIRWENRIRK